MRATTSNKGGGEGVARGDGRAAAAATVKAAKAQSGMACGGVMSEAGDEVDEAESGDGKEMRGVEQRAHAR